MTSRTKQGSDERRILIGMITDRKVLRAVAGHWTPEGLFASSHANLIGKLCVHYFLNYHKAPGRTIVTQFEAWAEKKARNKDVVELTDRFLGGLDEEYDPKNRPAAAAVIEMAEEHFARVRLKRIGEEAADLAAAGRVQEADELVSKYRPVTLNGASVRRFSEVKPLEVQWLWKPWLPAGELCILDGDPGMGKSTMLMDLAARVTRGFQMPPRESGRKSKRRKPGNVLLLAVEDSDETTIAPRLIAAGADTHRVIAPNDDCLTFPSGLPKIESIIRDNKVKLVLVDPIMSFLDPGTDSNKETDMRSTLKSVQRVAKRTGATFLMLRHLNKQSGGKSIYRGGGSIAFTAVCRVQHVVGIDPDDPEGFVFAASKMNLHRKPDPIRYRMEDAEIEFGDQTIHTSRIAWGATSSLTADAVVAATRAKSNKTDRAVGFVQKLLAKGPRPAAEVKAEATFELGLTASGWKETRRKAGIRSRRGPNGREYYLPET